MRICAVKKLNQTSPDEVDEFSESLLLESLLSDESLLESLDEL